MSRLVHRFLGYGLTDVRDGDPRLNRSSWLLTGEGEPPPAAYQEWVRARPCDETSLDVDWGGPDPARAWTLLDCIAVGGPDYGLPNVLMLRPYGQPGWARLDDTIDSVQEHLRAWQEDGPDGDPTVPRAEPVPGPLYPYLSWMDASTGQLLPDEVFTWKQAASAGGPRWKLDRAARDAGFAGHDDAAARVVPYVPREIRDLAEYARLFTSPGVIVQLRPVLYTYWS